MAKFNRTMMLASTGLALFAQPGFAQDAPSEEPVEPSEEPVETNQDGSLLSQMIVVTAQRRSENLQDVGISITAFSGDQLRTLGVEDSSDIATFTPGVHTSGAYAGQNTQFTIRGVTQSDFNDIVEAPNAVYLDEGYIAIAQGQTFSVLDIERVEVLKGPQGTLFGRNATGGLIHYISRRPSLSETTGYVDIRGRLYDSVDTPSEFTVETAIGGPVSSTLAARAAVRWTTRDPLLRNEYPAGAVGGSPGPGAGANIGDDDTLSGRLSVLFEAAPGAELILSANGARSNISTGPYQQKPTIAVYDATGELIDVIDAAPGETRASIIPVGSLNSINGDFGSDLNNDGTVGGPGELYGRPAGTDFFGYRDPDGADFRTSSDFAFGDLGDINTWGLNLRGEFELSDSITLNTVTDYKSFDKLLFIDVDAGPANLLANYGQLDADTISQELRLSGGGGPLEWVAGLYYLHIDNTSSSGLKIPVGSIIPGPAQDVDSTADLKTDSYSAFAQVSYDFTDQFRIVLGGRIIQEEKDYNFVQSVFLAPDSTQIRQGAPIAVIGPDFNPSPQPFTDQTSNTLWAGKVQLEFRPNDDVLLYAGINRGVKAGSFNAQLPGGLPAPTSFIGYGPETLINYEAGFRLTLADGLMTLNGSAYYYDYSDYQAFLFTGVSGYVINADARTYGGEVQLQTNPIDGLDLAVGISALDAVVRDVPLRIGGPIIRDVKPTYAPELQLNALVRYGWDMFGGQVYIGGDASYSSEYFYNLRNFDADRFDDYFLFNFGMGWTSIDDRFELAFDIDNVTDRRIGGQGFSLATLCGCNEVTYDAPRSFSLRARLNF